jgi:hypothetical protein
MRGRRRRKKTDVTGRIERRVEGRGGREDVRGRKGVRETKE